MKKIGIIGAGSWGTALATVVADKGNPVKIWDIDAGHLQRMEENRENVDYLPGVPLGENIAIATSQEDALRDADVFSAGAAFPFRTGRRTAVHKRRCSDHQCCKGHRAEEFEADV